MKRITLFLSAIALTSAAFSQTWNTMASGMNVGVNAIVEYKGKLIVGGYFNTAGGQTANHIAQWDGSQWSTLGTGLTGSTSFDNVAAMAVYNGDLYVAGIFTSAGGNAADYVAKWDGTSWSAVGKGVDHWVYCMYVFNGNLYVGGSFTTAGGSAAKGLAKWNGSTWSDVGGFSDIEVRGICSMKGDLYVGGTFNYVSKYDGSTWNKAANFQGSITTMASDTVNNMVYVGNSSTVQLYQYDNTAWSPIGTGVIKDGTKGGTPWALMVWNNKLYAGGLFDKVDGMSASNAAMWNGTTWSAIGAGLPGQVDAFGVYGGDLFAGGFFPTVGCIERYGLPLAIASIVGSENNSYAFPNPANEMISFHTDLQGGENIHIRLFCIF